MEVIGDYKVIALIGSGATAQVYMAKHTTTEEFVCIKRIAKDPQLNIEREIENMKKCDHDNIIKLHDIVERDDDVCLIMELASCGSLEEWLFKGPLDQGMCYRVFSQLVEAVSYLHTKLELMHRDIKVENILFAENAVLKLTDFGFSRENAGGRRIRATACGSAAYVAPEIIKREPYSFHADIWSMGIVLYYMAFGKPPFVDPNIQVVMNMIVTQEVCYPESADLDLKDLISRMLDKDCQTRITIEEVREHPWMTKMRRLCIPTSVLTSNSFNKNQIVRPRLISNSADVQPQASVGVRLVNIRARNLSGDVRRRMSTIGAALPVKQEWRRPSLMKPVLPRPPLLNIIH